jgi:hypothetical protein
VHGFTKRFRGDVYLGSNGQECLCRGQAGGADGGQQAGQGIVASIAAIHAGTVTAHPRDGGLSVMVTIPSAGAQVQAA